MRQLSGAQKKYLRGLAHSMEPIVHLGKNGLTDSFLGNVDQALEAHELIKLRFVDFKDQKRSACAEIEARLGAALAGMIGHVAILYRPARDPADRKIGLPERPLPGEKEE